MSAGSNIVGANVTVAVRGNTAQLKQLLADFRAGKIGAQELKKATDDLKTSVTGQAQALRALNQANRVQNFQTFEMLRTMRNLNSLFMDFNQVAQTFILRNIDGTTQTVAQRQAFEDLQTSGRQLISMLDTLGSENGDVQKGFSNFVKNLDNLSSGDLKDLIGDFKEWGKQANLSASEQEKFNETLEKMNDQLKETELKEKTKQFTDFFTAFAGIAGLATSMGTFIAHLKTLNLLKNPQPTTTPTTVPGTTPSGTTTPTPIKPGPGQAGKAPGGTGFGGPGAIGAISIAALVIQVLDFLGLAPKGGKAPDTSFKTLDELTKFLENFGKTPTAAAEPVTINNNFGNITLANDVDLERFTGSLTKIMQDEMSKKAK